MQSDERERGEQRVSELERMKRLYAVWSRVSEAILHARDEHELLEAACRIAVEEGGFALAWIGFVNAETNRIDVLAKYGRDEGYLDSLNISLDESVPEGRGPTAVSLRECRPFVNNDTENNPVMAPWRDEQLKRGIRSSASLPLKAGDACIGAITLYSDVPGSFDHEEMRLLTALADDFSFALEAAGGAKQKAEAVEALRDARAELESRVRERTAELKSAADENARLLDEEREAQASARADLVGMTRLQSLGSLSLSESNMESVLNEILDAAISLSAADFGNIQLIDPESGDLKIVVARGFPDWWLEFWESVAHGQGACGTALERGERVIIEDVAQSPIFLGSPAADIQLRAGVHAVQSTPLITRSGRPVGMFSTHFKHPHRPDDRTLRLLDLLARQAADMIERLRSEQALTESRTRADELASLLDTASQPFAVGGLDGQVRHYNPAYRELIGYTDEEMRTADWQTYLTPPEYREMEAERLARLVETGQPVRYEKEYVRKDGSRVPIELLVGILYDENGEPDRYYSFVTDLSERDAAQVELRDSEERYRLLFANLLDGYAYCEMLFDEQGTPVDFVYLDVNPMFERLTGLHDVIGKRVTEVIPGIRESNPEVFEIYGRVTKTGAPETFETELPQIERTLHVSVYRPSEGHFVAVFDDVTDRKRADELTQARLRMLTEASSGERSTGELIRLILDEIEELTGSAIAFYHFVEADQETLRLIEWSTHTLAEACEAEGRGTHYPVASAGVWADAVRERRPVIHNDYDSLPDRRGLPDGHAPLVRELVVPILRGERIVAVIGVGNKEIAYSERDVETVAYLGDLSWEIVERRRAQDELQTELARTSFLREIASHAAKSSELRELGEGVLDIARRRLGASSGIIFRIDEPPGVARPLAVFGLPADSAAATEDLPIDEHSMGGRSILTGEVLVSRGEEAPPRTVKRTQAAGKESHRFVTFPAKALGKIVGMVGLGFEGESMFGVEDSALYEAIGDQVGVAMENVRLFEAERNVADRLQTALLSLPEEVPGIEFAHEYRSAAEEARVGGDFYDLFELSADHIGVLVGDVAGKGLDAAAMTSMVKNTIRAHASERGKTPSRILELTNEVVFKATTTEAFVTVFFGIIDCRDGRLVYASAGHTTGAVASTDGRVARLPATGPLLGAFHDVTFGQAEARLELDNVLFLYTDGLTEARRDSELYGEERLFALLSTADGQPSDVIQRVVHDVVMFAGGQLRDDLAILAVKRAHPGVPTARQEKLEV